MGALTFNSGYQSPAQNSWCCRTDPRSSHKPWPRPTPEVLTALRSIVQKLGLCVLTNIGRLVVTTDRSCQPSLVLTIALTSSGNASGLTS